MTSRCVGYGCGINGLKLVLQPGDSLDWRFPEIPTPSLSFEVALFHLVIVLIMFVLNEMVLVLVLVLVIGDVAITSTSTAYC